MPARTFPPHLFPDGSPVAAVPRNRYVHRLNMPSEREIAILELLANGNAATQRQVADASGFSLGFVNAVVRRLVRTGHLKIQSLTAKKVRYILTPKGLSEKSRRSYDYLKRTVRTYNTCLERIGSLIDGRIQSGQRRFVVVGEGDIAELVSIALRLKAPSGVNFERRVLLDKADEVTEVCILNCGEPDTGDIGISVLNEILVAGERTTEAA